MKQYQLKGKCLHDGIVELRIKWNILVCRITRFIMDVIAGNIYTLHYRDKFT